jgi:DNA-binding transcriptional ArsR family regulator
MLNTLQKRKRKPMPAPSNLDATFNALADPTRRAILERLAEGDATVLELAAPFSISLPAISRHLKILETAGLIERGRDAQKRPCRLRAEALAPVAAWADHTRRAWEARFDSLAAYLEKLKSEPQRVHTAPELETENTTDDLKNR